MTARTMKAEYTDQVLPEHQRNLLIEALPDIMSVEETLFCLTRMPAYSKS